MPGIIRLHGQCTVVTPKRFVPLPEVMQRDPTVDQRLGKIRTQRKGAVVAVQGLVKSPLIREARRHGRQRGGMVRRSASARS